MKLIFSAKPANAVLVQIVKGGGTLFLENSKKERILQVGIAKNENVTFRKYILLCRQTIALAKSHKIRRIAIDCGMLRRLTSGVSPALLARTFAVNAVMADFEPYEHKTPPEGGWDTIEEVVITGSMSGEEKLAFQRGLIIGQEVNESRRLSNMPGGHMTPRILAASAKRAGAATPGVATKILGRKEIEKLGMGGVLGVAQGSQEEPQFIIMEYWGAKKTEKPVVLVGKGVTFDTGGLNLKPDSAIYEMHLDMSGGAAVIHALILAAKTRLKKNVIALVPAVENMPSGSSYRPGDILKTMSGKTIEVLNTDAEGRVILSDALTYAKRYNPGLVVDVATLTGAAMVALGLYASALFTRDEKIEKMIRELGEESGDYVWPLPLWDEYFDEIKGTFGDVANTGRTRYGGAINGAMFLYQFAKDYPWAHLDIAPRMTAMEGEFLAKGSSGTPVRLLYSLLERY